MRPTTSFWPSLTSKSVCSFRLMRLLSALKRSIRIVPSPLIEVESHRERREPPAEFAAILHHPARAAGLGAIRPVRVRRLRISSSRNPIQDHIRIILNPAVPCAATRHLLCPQWHASPMLVTITVNCGAVGSEANKGRICAARDSTAGFRIIGHQPDQEELFCGTLALARQAEPFPRGNPRHGPRRRGVDRRLLPGVGWPPGCCAHHLGDAARPSGRASAAGWRRSRQPAPNRARSHRRVRPPRRPSARLRLRLLPGSPGGCRGQPAGFGAGRQRDLPGVRRPPPPNWNTSPSTGSRKCSATRATPPACW